LLTVCTFTAGYVVGTAARRHGHFSLVSFVLTSLTIVGVVLIWIQNLSVYMQLPLLGFLVLIAKLAYEGEGGPALAYRFERFEEKA
jgi:hypothetical protein